VLFDQGKPVGTASLAHDDLAPRRDLTPWLAGVFVEPAYRGCGFASLLVRQDEAFALAASVPTLWLYTWTAESLYARLGWQRVGLATNRGEEVVLMSRHLSDRYSSQWLSVFDNFPIWILLSDRGIPECIEITSIDLDPNPSGRRAGRHSPFADTGLPINEVKGISVVDIRQLGKPSSEALSYILYANISRPKRWRASRLLKHTIIGKEAHDGLVLTVRVSLQEFAVFGDFVLRRYRTIIVEDEDHILVNW
jgi:hypothetical protein